MPEKGKIDQYYFNVSLLTRIQVHALIYETAYFGPRVLPRGSLVIALVRPWPEVRWSVSVGYLRDCSLFFYIFCMKLEYLNGLQVNGGGCLTASLLKV